MDRDKLEKKKKFRKRLYYYVLKLVKFLSSLPKTSVGREIISQIMRSGTSIGANYFEAEAASSKKDYQNYFHHSLKSANETKFWLAVLIDSKLILPNKKSEAEWLLKETKELANIFASSLSTMKNKR